MRLYCYAMSIVGDADACRDILNEVFLRLWGTKTDIDERHIYAYLVKAVRHAAVDYLRNEVKMREFREEALKNMSPLDTDYSDEMEKDKLVYRMIAGLKPPADTIVEMKYLKEMKVNEIAQQLDMSVNTIKKHLVKSLKKLRAIYKGQKLTQNR